MQKFFTVTSGFCLFMLTAICQPEKQEGKTGIQKSDDQGNFINAHGGGVLYFSGTYYLFGEIKKGDTYLVPGQNWEDFRVSAGGVSCYSSKDLRNWEYKGVALAPVTTHPDNDLDSSRVIERPKVIYNERTRKFVMWLHIDKADYSFAHAGVAVSDRPEGPYQYLGSVRPNGQECRDMTVFKDDDDRAYLIYASENNNTMQVCLLSDDYLSPTSTYNRMLINQRREAPAMFKYNGKYFLITSLCSGWSPNAALYSVADSLMGRWENHGNPCAGPGSDTTYGAQSSFVLPLPGSPGSFIFMADRWNKTNLRDSRYLWIPFSTDQEVLKIKNDSEIVDDEWKISGKVRFGNASPDPWKPAARMSPASILYRRTDVNPYSVLQYSIKIRGEEGKPKGKNFIRFYDSDDKKLLEYKTSFTSTPVFQETGNYTEAPPFTRYALMGIETDSSDPGTLYVDSFHLELNIGEPLSKRHAMYNPEEYMRPFWNSDTIFSETVLMISDQGGTAEGRLLYNPDHIISVKSFDMAAAYNEQDYTLQGRTIQRTPQSKIPFVTGDFFDTKNDLAWYNLQSRWIQVTYTHHDSWTGPVPAYKGDHLPRLMKKLTNKLPLTIIGYGMSITRGMNISSYDDVPPYMPTYLELFTGQLRKKYGYEDIKLLNAGLPGALVSWGADNADAYINPVHPDLVIIDFGMNDFWRYTPEAFKNYIQTIIDKVKEKNPESEFILVSTMDFDPAYILDTDKNKSFYVSNMQGYKKVLRDVETTGIVMLDMMSLSDAIYSRKKAKDCVTNPLHPNDYLARWYAQSMTALLVATGLSQDQSATTENFDSDWFFHRGGMLGAENEPMDKRAWRRISLPHDWSIEDLPGTKSAFNPDAISQVGGGFTTGGSGWYRKSFFVSASDKNKKLIIQFDGVYMNADVYINGNHVGNHPYGYTSFYYDISQWINPGDSNLIAVEVKNEGQNSRWYSGSGIYRHVWLRKLEPVHIEPWSTCITTPHVTHGRAAIDIKSLVVNNGKDSATVTLVSKIVNRESEEIARGKKEWVMAPGDKKEITIPLEIKNPQLWSCESPYLYDEITEIYQNSRLIYRERNHFGIRTISFDAKSGFLLNGNPVKLKGGCFHIDNGPLGSAAYDRAEERKVELLKTAGFNAIRCSHNPPSPAFLDACDRLGMLVIDEAFDMWNTGKNSYDYHLYFRDWWKKDIQSMVMRDRNHPSIVMWSIGNEIPEQGTMEGTETSNMLSRYIRLLDSTRPTTVIANELKPEMDSFFATVGVAGYNYAIADQYNPSNAYTRDHQRVPDRIMYGSETYPLKAFASWMAVQDLSYVVGDFVWTAFDYIGESSIGWLGYPQKKEFYPWNLAYCGDLDVCGWRRPQSYYREALWKKNQLSVFVQSPYNTFKKDSGTATWAKWYWKDVWPEWNWSGYENKPLDVNVYSSCDQVELFLNGKSLGTKATNQSNEYIAVWSVPFQPGVLKAVGTSNGIPVQTSVLQTASGAKHIKLTADRTNLHGDGQDLSYIQVELTDDHGVTNPSAQNTIRFSIAGDGEIAGVGNANPMSLESFQLPVRKAWKGRCLVIVKAGKTGGKIHLIAGSDGFPSSEIVLNVKKDGFKASGAYYVSPNGNDQHAGSRTAPFRTIGKLNSILFYPGDSIFFEGGQHFPGSLTIHQSGAGDTKHPIVIRSYGKGRATIEGGKESAVIIHGAVGLDIKKLILTGSGRKEGNTREGLSIRNSHDVTVDSIEITGFQKSGLDIEFSDNIQIRNVFSHGNGAAGISAGTEGDSKKSNRNIYIGYCRAENNPGDPTNLTNHSGNGIVIGNSTNVLIENCTATNNGWDMPRKGNGPVGIWAYESDSVVIQHCLSYRNKTSVGGADGGGFDLDGGVTHSVVQYCLSYENQGAGYCLFQYLYASPWHDNVFRYNISENDGAGSDPKAGIYIWNSSRDSNQFYNAWFYNNSIYNAKKSALSYSELSERKHFTFCNNIFESSDSLVKGNAGHDLFIGNDWWGRVRAGTDRHNVYLNPGFKNPGKADVTYASGLKKFDHYRLPSDSPLRTGGIHLGKTYGIDIGNIDFNGRQTMVSGMGACAE